MFYPTWFILNMLVTSIFTAFILCKLCNKPFFHPQLYNSSYIIHKISNTCNVLIQYTINYNIIYYSIVQYKLQDYLEDSTSRILHNIQYILILEFIAYWVHRISHSITYIYKNSHSHHHSNHSIYPVDFLQVDYIDNAMHALYMSLPLYFVPICNNDYTMIYYMYSIGGFLVHSDIITNVHVIHHKMFKYNFCALFPIFDIVFGTYKTL
jgi:sterol desaturase/sphingolipid hydroxylase (fatty acid hydroxylase superfamily)